MKTTYKDRLQKVPYKDRLHEVRLLAVPLDIVSGIPNPDFPSDGYPESYTLQELYDRLKVYAIKNGFVRFPVLNNLRIKIEVEHGWEGDSSIVRVDLYEAKPWTPAEVYKAEKLDKEEEDHERRNKEIDEANQKKSEIAKLKELATKHPDELKKMLP